MNKCRRKYFYKYKLGVPEDTSIELELGNLVHQAIKQKVEHSDKSIEDIFDQLWEEEKDKLGKFRLSKAEADRYYKEYRKMVQNWEMDFNADAKMQCEVPLKSENYHVLGVVDEISEKEGKVRILDNKTPRIEGLSKDHETQLAIYALLYLENFGKLPDHIGIRFLRTGSKQYLPVNDKLISKAIFECKMMRVKNLANNIQEYPRNPSPLCNWGKGQCSYLERCFP